MKKNEYLVQIAVIEARDLAAKDSSGSSDPFVKITVGNLPTQVSTAKMKATTAVFNQNFTFEGLRMSDVDFENFEAKIEMYDQNQFFQNELIGIHSIGLATLYRNPSHEIYNSWLRLTHPKEVNKVQGYILISAYIIGQNDAPPVHDANENNVEDEPDPFGGVPDDQLTGEQLQQRRENQKKIAMVCKPMPYTKLAQLMVNIVKAEDLPILNGTTIDSFISVRANGITQITSVLKNQQKPQYRVRMMFPINFPLQNDKIIIRVWDKRVCMADTFIGQIPEFPSENDFFNITYLQSKGGVLPFRWFSLYGIPTNERPSTYESNVLGYKKNPRGTCYMGRVLLSLNLTPSEKPEKIVQPLGIYREPAIERFMLRLDTYEVNQAKDLDEFIFIRVRVGKEYFDSSEADCKSPGQFVWRNKVILKAWEVEVPKNPSEQTDIFVELMNKEKKRVAYIRVIATSPDLTNDKPQWYEFKDLKLKGEQEGVHSYVLMNLLFGQINIISQIPKIIVKKNMVLPYICKIYLYCGFDFCPDKVHNEISLSYEIRIANQVYKSEQNKNSKNPIWNVCIRIPVSMEQNLEFVSNLVISFFNHKEPIGQANVSAINCRVSEEEIIQPIYQIFHILQNGKSKGRIILGVTLQRKKKNDKIDPKISISEIITQFKEYKVVFPVYAIRSLPKKLRKAQLFARISNPNQDSVENVDSYLQGDEEETRFSPGYTDPNFLKLLILDIQLPENPLLMPQLNVEIYSKESLSQKYYFSIPLYNHYPGLDQKTYNKLNSYYYATLESGMLSANVPPPDLTPEIDENQTEEQEQEDQEEPKTIFTKKSIKPSIKEKQSTKSKQSTKQKTEVLAQKLEKSSDVIQKRMRTRGIENAYVQDEIVLVLDDEDVLREQLLKKEKQAKLTKLLKTLPKPLNTELNKQFLKKAILEQIFKIQDLETYFTERAIEMSDDGIDYGRPIIKGQYDSEIQKGLPFQRYKIYELNKNASGQGQETTAILKADVKLININTFKQTVKQQQQQNDEKKTKKAELIEKAEYVKRLRQADYPFDFFDPVFHDYLKQQQFRCKVRVYIYRGLSLAAQSENIDAYHYMAGEQSRNSANPYLEIEVGEPGADPGEFVKKVSDPDKFIQNTLNPTFLRSFELDAILPQDCFLHIRVFNKGGLTNKLIGAVKIDIEDRLMGEKKLKSRLSCEAYKDYFLNDLERLKYTENADDIKLSYQAEIANLTQKIESITTLEIPVEYQQLRHPDKLVSQGQLEMFVEVLPLEVSRLIPPALLVERLPQEYEVRLIVWETFNIPLNPIKKAVDIFVRCVMDSSATGTGQEIFKETDTHMGSTDGNGEFNWRMKFNFKTPCQFPRMKISVHDFSVFGASPIIGEATISLKRVLTVMKTQAIYEMAPTQIKLSSAKEPDVEKGTVMLQMTILQKSMAEAKPVGEAQEEPNIDPFLKKPTEGRGLGAFFKGIGIPWGMICKQACMILLPMFISALVSFILFVKPGILMPPTPGA